MVRLIFFIFTFIGFGYKQAVAQTDSLKQLKLLKTIKGNFKDFTLDKLGNLLLVNERQQIKKLNNNYDSTAVFNDIRKYGQLYAIDASNPLKILLFYKDFSTIVVLDRFLNIRNTIDLRLGNIYQPKAICQSYDNNIWVFDELDFKIKKVDEKGTLLQETADLRILYNDAPKPITLIDNNKFLFGYDSAKGLLVMDYYGSVKNFVAFKNWQNIQTFTNGIIATTQSSIEFYEPGTINTKTLKLPITIFKDSKKIILSGRKLYVLFKDEVKIWEF